MTEKYVSSHGMYKLKLNMWNSHLKGIIQHHNHVSSHWMSQLQQYGRHYFNRDKIFTKRDNKVHSFVISLKNSLFISLAWLCAASELECVVIDPDCHGSWLWSTVTAVIEGANHTALHSCSREQYCFLFHRWRSVVQEKTGANAWGLERSWSINVSTVGLLRVALFRRLLYCWLTDKGFAL